MARRNVTIQLDEEIIRRARMLAAQRDSSISRLLAEQVEVLVQADATFQAAHREAAALLDHGFELGITALPGRDELHAR